MCCTRGLVATVTGKNGPRRAACSNLNAAVTDQHTVNARTRHCRVNLCAAVVQICRHISRFAAVNHSREQPYGLEAALQLWINKVGGVLNGLQNAGNTRSSQLMAPVKDMAHDLSNGVALSGTLAYYQPSLLSVCDIRYVAEPGESSAEQAKRAAGNLRCVLTTAEQLGAPCPLSIDNIMASSHLLRPVLLAWLAHLFTLLKKQPVESRLAEWPPSTHTPTLETAAPKKVSESLTFATSTAGSASRPSSRRGRPQSARSTSSTKTGFSQETTGPLPTAGSNTTKLTHSHGQIPLSMETAELIETSHQHPPHMTIRSATRPLSARGRESNRPPSIPRPHSARPYGKHGPHDSRRKTANSKTSSLVMANTATPRASSSSVAFSAKEYDTGVAELECMEWREHESHVEDMEALAQLDVRKSVSAQPSASMPRYGVQHAMQSAVDPSSHVNSSEAAADIPQQQTSIKDVQNLPSHHTSTPATRHSEPSLPAPGFPPTSSTQVHSSSKFQVDLLKVESFPSGSSSYEVPVQPTTSVPSPAAAVKHCAVARPGTATVSTGAPHEGDEHSNIDVSMSSAVSNIGQLAGRFNTGEACAAAEMLHTATDDVTAAPLARVSTSINTTATAAAATDAHAKVESQISGEPTNIAPEKEAPTFANTRAGGIPDANVPGDNEQNDAHNGVTQPTGRRKWATTRKSSSVIPDRPPSSALRRQGSELSVRVRESADAAAAAKILLEQENEALLAQQAKEELALARKNATNASGRRNSIGKKQSGTPTHSNAVNDSDDSETTSSARKGKKKQTSGKKRRSGMGKRSRKDGTGDSGASSNDGADTDASGATSGSEASEREPTPTPPPSPLMRPNLERAHRQVHQALLRTEDEVLELLAQQSQEPQPIKSSSPGASQALDLAYTDHDSTISKPATSVAHSIQSRAPTSSGTADIATNAAANQAQVTASSTDVRSSYKVTRPTASAHEVIQTIPSTDGTFAPQLGTKHHPRLANASGKPLVVHHPVGWMPDTAEFTPPSPRTMQKTKDAEQLRCQFDIRRRIIEKGESTAKTRAAEALKQARRVRFPLVVQSTLN